jgi:monoamine oxidase
MKSMLGGFCVLALLASAPAAIQAIQKTPLTITLKNGSASEAETKAQLEKFLAQYDLSRWIVTREIVIDEKTGIPHSHPVLTLNTNYTGRELLLLSTFLHEELHWFANAHAEDRDQAVAELEELFPDLPTQPPDGSRGRFSSYQHVLVCYLEFSALKDLVGAEKAREVIEFWAGHHYRAIYRLVLDQPERLRAVVEKHNLIPSVPAPLAP